MKRFIIASIAGLILFLILVVWHSPYYQTIHILRTYGFHPNGMPKQTSIILDETTFELFNESSKELGYNLQSYKGKKAEVLQYSLQERYVNEHEELVVYANFLLNDKHQLIGALLEVKGMKPGLISFNANKPNY
jgi:hypothetical protein